MARNVTISIPHALEQPEAKRRIDAAIQHLTGKFAKHVSSLEADWVDNKLTGQLRALGQTVTGHVDVDADEVRIDLTLPLIMSLLSPKIESFALKTGQRILS